MDTANNFTYSSSNIFHISSRPTTYYIRIGGSITEMTRGNVPIDVARHWIMRGELALNVVHFGWDEAVDQEMWADLDTKYEISDFRTVDEKLHDFGVHIQHDFYMGVYDRKDNLILNLTNFVRDEIFSNNKSQEIIRESTDFVEIPCNDNEATFGELNVRTEETGYIEYVFQTEKPFDESLIEIKISYYNGWPITGDVLYDGLLLPMSDNRCGYNCIVGSIRLCK